MAQFGQWYWFKRVSVFAASVFSASVLAMMLSLLLTWADILPDVLPRSTLAELDGVQAADLDSPGCQYIRLDKEWSDQKVIQGCMKNVPVKDQSFFGFCFAYAAAQYVDCFRALAKQTCNSVRFKPLRVYEPSLRKKISFARWINEFGELTDLDSPKRKPYCPCV